MASKWAIMVLTTNNLAQCYECHSKHCLAWDASKEFWLKTSIEILVKIRLGDICNHFRFSLNSELSEESLNSVVSSVLILLMCLYAISCSVALRHACVLSTWRLTSVELTVYLKLRSLQNFENISRCLIQVKENIRVLNFNVHCSIPGSYPVQYLQHLFNSCVGRINTTDKNYRTK